MGQIGFFGETPRSPLHTLLEPVNYGILDESQICSQCAAKLQNSVEARFQHDLFHAALAVLAYSAIRG